MTKKSKMIEIDLEIYRLIETNRLSFDETLAEILRRLLGLKPSDKQKNSGRGMNLGYGVILPGGTLLKGEYKRAECQAEIKEGGILFDGERYNSLSAAAKKFGGPNGWKFWKWAKRSQDSEWVILNELRDQGSIPRRRVGVAHINLSKEELADFPQE
ncbi:MAG: DUF2924 domain-containing protein [Deltaproteobacteria bacterium]|nr:DUF2924 domain-containing protein [Deltaproteobacteria bacterium]